MVYEATLDRLGEVVHVRAGDLLVLDTDPDVEVAVLALLRDLGLLAVLTDREVISFHTR